MGWLGTIRSYDGIVVLNADMRVSRLFRRKPARTLTLLNGSRAGQAFEARAGQSDGGVTETTLVGAVL